MNTHEAWSNNRPVRDRLPGINGGYSENIIADWLTDYPDSVLVDLLNTLNDLPRQVDPRVSDPNWLDYLAPLFGATNNYWQRDWNDLAKRTLLTEAYTTIWPGKGTKEVLSLVLITLNILHVIRAKSSFIIGESEVGDAIGSLGWQYELILPSSYYGTSFEKTAKAANSLFSPCWCITTFIYDDQYFSPEELLTVDSESGLLVETDTALKV